MFLLTLWRSVSVIKRYNRRFEGFDVVKMCHSECRFYFSTQSFYLTVQETFVSCRNSELRVSGLFNQFSVSLWLKKRAKDFSSCVEKLLFTSCRMKAVKLKVFCLHSPAFCRSFAQWKIRSSCRLVPLMIHRCFHFMTWLEQKLNAQVKSSVIVCEVSFVWF